MNRAYTLVMAFAIAPMLFLACTKSETGNGNKDELEFHHITLTAGSTSDNDEAAEGTSSKCLNGDGADGISTKAIFAENVKANTDFYWQATDKIGVLASGSESLYQLDIEARSENLKTATFGGEIKGELGSYAVYPYNENHKISENTLTYHLPSEYDFSFTYMDADYLDSSENVDSYRMSANPALLAKITADGGNEDEASCEFKHLAGMLCIKMDKVKSTDVNLTIIADRQISGDFSVDLTSSEPVIKTTSEATADSDIMGTGNTVTIKGRITNQNGGCVFYIPMPVGEYNLRVKIGDNFVNYGEWYCVSPVKTLEIGRSNIKRASLKYDDLHKNGGYMLVNGITYIDLGLPSGKLWGASNIGASLPGDCGNYYSAADASSGLNSTKIHVPSEGEFNELVNNTVQEYTSGEKDSAGEWTAGVYFKNKKDNSQYIFFPFSGFKYNSGGATEMYKIEHCSWSTTGSEYAGQTKDFHVALSNGKPEAYMLNLDSSFLLTIRAVINP